MSYSRFLFILVIGAVGALSSAQRGTPSSDDLLDAVVQANTAIKFKGNRIVTFRFEREGKPVSRRFTEIIVRDGEKVRTEYTGDEEIGGQIAVDDGRSRYHYFPKLNVIHKSPSLQHQNSERLEMLMQERRKEYTVTVADGEEVAKMDTYIITLKSQRGITHKVWVDKRGKAILKREFQGPNANMGSSYEFEFFEYRRRIDSDNFQINKPGVRVLDPADRLALAAKKVEYATYEISGDRAFKLYEAGTYEAGDKVKVLRSIYGDGKIVVTMHQFKGSLDPDRFKGRGNSRTQVHSWRADGYNFVLVGDLPANELERLARLVRR